jgi:hypothetical protein
MATVRITNSICSYVRYALEALYNGRIERKREELQHLDIGNVCYQHEVPAKYRELAQQLNADANGTWLDEQSSISIKMVYQKNNAGQTMATARFSVPIKPPVPVPHRFRGYGTAFNLLEGMAPYEHAKKIYLDIEAMEEERNKLIEHIVDGVLAKCSTLKQVLKLWPTALDFMPDEVKQRHAAKSGKRSPTAEQLPISDDVKVSLMKARMLATGS